MSQYYLRLSQEYLHTGGPNAFRADMVGVRDKTSIAWDDF